MEIEQKKFDQEGKEEVEQKDSLNQNLDESINNREKNEIDEKLNIDETPAAAEEETVVVKEEDKVKDEEKPNVVEINNNNDNDNDNKNEDRELENNYLISSSYSNIESINLESINCDKPNDNDVIEQSKEHIENQESTLENEKEEQQKDEVIVEEQIQTQQKQQDEINEDEYDILNKNDVLNSIDSKLAEIDEKITIEEIKENKIDVNNEEVVVEENPVDIKKNESEVEEQNPVLDILGNGSLIKRLIKKGVKDQRPKNGQICTISYQLRLANNLDFVVEENIAFDFLLGDGDVVPALDIAVSLMDLNEECEVTTECRHGYGEKGELPKIPENAKLVYNLTLLKFDFPPELNKLETIERLSLAESKKQRGNYHYNRQNYDQAVASYRKGLKYFYDYNLSNNETKEDLDKFNDVKVALYMNVALSNYKLQSYNDALEALDNVLKHHSKHVKALFIKGKILFHIGEVGEAIKFFNKAIEIDDKNPDILKELGRAQAKYKLQYAKEKEMYQKMISGVSPTSTEKEVSKKKTNNKKSNNSSNNNKNNNNNNSSFFSYLATAGVIVAIASIGFAAYAKYKNLL